MKELGSRLGLTYLIITHNLNLVGYVADRIAVMYLGQLVEVGPTDRIFDAPAHPYTRALLASISEPDPRQRRDGRRLLLPGEIPSPRNPPSGCRFHTRCPYAQARSREEVPELEEIERGHFVACHFWRQIRDVTRAFLPRRRCLQPAQGRSTVSGPGAKEQCQHRTGPCNAAWRRRRRRPRRRGRLGARAGRLPERAQHRPAVGHTRAVRGTGADEGGPSPLRSKRCGRHHDEHLADRRHPEGASAGADR